MNVLEETIKGFVKEGIEVTLVYDEKTRIRVQFEHNGKK